MRSDNAAEPTGSANNTRTNQLLRFAAILTYVLTIFTNVRYSFGRRSPWDDGHQDDVAFTPFTANGPAIMLFWLVTIVCQFVYLAGFFLTAPWVVNIQYVMSNLLLMGWSYLFARGHYFLSEILVIVNFLQLLGAYMLVGTFRIKPLKNWLAIHGSVVVFPLIWSHYLIYWNGAVLFGARNFGARIVANFLIWLFLLVPGALMMLTGDYVLGFASTWIAFAIGLGQLLTKVFALQWIFAFIIGTILLLGTMLLAFVPPSNRFVPFTAVEARQETFRDQETAPLLTDR